MNFGNFFSRGSPDVRPPRTRLSIDIGDMTVYAVGDVHGCLDELRALENEIRRDAARLPGEKLIIMLGDYVDRGPSSAGVIAHLLSPPPEGFTRICLAGNHEVAMLDFLEGRIPRRDWVGIGAKATLLSYGIDADYIAGMGNDREDAVIRRMVPKSHLAFLKALPVLVESPRYVFVHAGIRPGVPLAEQSDRELTTIRTAFTKNADLLDRFVVHGHTPIETPQLEGRRLNIDTAAFRTGRLTGVRIWRDTGRFLEGKRSEGGLPGLPEASQR